MDDTLRELYQDVILDHSRHPRHFGKLDGATNSAQGHNPLCGDRVTVQLLVDKNDRIADMAGVSAFPLRFNCATLAWHSMISALVGGGSAKSD
jgi:NifU-like protein involved in Fe-S cluster formation